MHTCPLLCSFVHGGLPTSDPTGVCLLCLQRTLAFNMVEGVSNGFSKTLEMVGTGFRASVAGEELTLNVGYCKPRVVAIPEGITVKVRVRTRCTQHQPCTRVNAGGASVVTHYQDSSIGAGPGLKETSGKLAETLNQCHWQALYALLCPIRWHFGHCHENMDKCETWHT